MSVVFNPGSEGNNEELIKDNVNEMGASLENQADNLKLGTGTSLELNLEEDKGASTPFDANIIMNNKQGQESDVQVCKHTFENVSTYTYICCKCLTKLTYVIQITCNRCTSLRKSLQNQIRHCWMKI